MATLVVLINLAAAFATGGHWLTIAALIVAVWARLHASAASWRGNIQSMPTVWALLIPVCGIIGIVMLIVGLRS